LSAPGNGFLAAYHFDPVARRGGEMPNAILPAGVRVRIVGAADFAVRRRDLVLATALLAVVLVLVQREPVVARTLVRTGRVLALVLATAVVHGTLVHVCETANGQSSTYYVKNGTGGETLKLEPLGKYKTGPRNCPPRTP